LQKLGLGQAGRHPEVAKIAHDGERVRVHQPSDPPCESRGTVRAVRPQMYIAAEVVSHNRSVPSPVLIAIMSVPG
jgi:hypothetical protein